MESSNFKEMNICYHEYFSSVLGVWAYKNGKRCGLKPFSVNINPKVGHYIFRCGEENTFYVIADPEVETLVVSHVFSDGHTCVTESYHFSKPEVALGEAQIEVWLWSLVHDNPSFYKEEVA